MAERLAEAPWRNCCRPGRRGGEPSGKQLLAGALMRMAGVFLAEKEWQRRSGREGVAEKEWQRRSGSGGVAVKPGGLAKPERKNFAICAREVSWYLLDFLVNFVNWSDF